MTDKDTIDQAPELFDQAGPEPKAAESTPAMAPAIQQVQQLPIEQRQTPDVSTAQGLLAVILQDHTMTPAERLALAKELIALKNSEEARSAEKEFNEHFSAMQGEFEAVQKTRQGQFGPYADINDILAVYGPILSRNGFGWSFPEEEIEGKPGWKRVFCVIRGYGHSERTPFVCPPPPENKGSSAIQKESGNTTYGKRVAFCSAVGVFLKDEDKDGDLTFDDGVKLGPVLELLRDAKTQGERRAVYVAAIARTDLDEREKRIISEASKKRNKELFEAGVKE